MLSLTMQEKRLVDHLEQAVRRIVREELEAVVAKELAATTANSPPVSAPQEKPKGKTNR